MMEYDEIVAGLRRIADWNGFAASLLDQHTRKGGLSERQYDAAEAMLLKVRATQEHKRAESRAVDASRIETLLQTAVMAGLKRPAFRAEGLTFTLAKATSANAGAVYAKQGDLYVGKIMGGKFHPVKDTPSGTGDAIARIAADPRGAAIEHGRTTGQCACCGRTLTDPASIALGIGPICAENWGL